MRKRAGLARALVLDPEIILVDEPDSGLDPVRITYISQLFLDINAQTDATFLIVTHNIGPARTVPGQPRHAVPPRAGDVRPARGAAHQRGAGRQAVPQRPHGRPDRHERGEGLRAIAAEKAMFEARPPPPAASAEGQVTGIPPQMQPSPGVPERQGAIRRQQRVLDMLHTLPAEAQDAIKKLMDEETAGRRNRRSPSSSQRQSRCRRPPRRSSPPSRARPATVRQRTELARTWSRCRRSAVCSRPVACSPSSWTSGGSRSSGPFQVREFIEQAWFIASVTIVPTSLVAIPFGAVIALQLGSLPPRSARSPSSARRACSPSCARRARSCARC